MVIKNILDGVWLHKGQEYHRFLQFSSKVQVACRGRIHEFHKKTHEIYGPLTPYHKPKLVKFGQIVFKKKIKRIKCFFKTHIMHDDGGKHIVTIYDQGDLGDQKKPLTIHSNLHAFLRINVNIP